MQPPRGHAVEPGQIRVVCLDTADHPADATCGSTSQPTRRDVVRQGARLAFVAPAISTFFASQAYATNYSCYALGHACPGEEPCCQDLTCADGECVDAQGCIEAPGLCFGDADCCSGDCQLGVCQ